MSDERNAIQDALRGASDGLLFAIREVDARERLKRGVPPGDPGFLALARQVTVAAEAALILAQREEERAGQTAGKDAVGRFVTIDASEPQPDLAAILAEWRAVDRRLDAADPASAAAARLMQEFEQLRTRYADALRMHMQDR